MQYILTEEEYKALMPVTEHQNIKYSLLEYIEKCNVKLAENNICMAEIGGYCEKCIIGMFGANTCKKNIRRYKFCYGTPGPGPSPKGSSGIKKISSKLKQ